LRWPDQSDQQQALQAAVIDEMTGRYGAWDELVASIETANGDGEVAILDPFSGRGMIPLEAARLGIKSYALEYSPLAVLASRALADYPYRDWSGEPTVPLYSSEQRTVIS
jgi:putative DNA methylase